MQVNDLAIPKKDTIRLTIPETLHREIYEAYHSNEF